MRIGRLGIIGGAGAAVAIIVAIAAANAGQSGTNPSGPLQGNFTGMPPVVAPPTLSFDIFHIIPDGDLPKVVDPSFKVEKVVEGLSSPTSMAFIDNQTLLILEKETGKVRLVANGTLAPDPVATFPVETASERGLLGIAVHGSDVFLYMTENDSGDIRERVYRFAWHDGMLDGKTRILDAYRSYYA